MITQTGLTHTSTLTVGQQHTAQALGSGDMPVLATPQMVALMENAAMLAVAQQLEASETTVGTQITVSHVRASKVGAEVRATARLTAIDGRRLDFEVEAYDGPTLIGQGTHTRFVVQRERFMAKL